MPSLTFERVTLVLLIGLTLWQARELNQTGRHVNQLSTGMTELTTALAELKADREKLSLDLGRARDAMIALEASRAELGGGGVPLAGRPRGAGAGPVELDANGVPIDPRAARRAREPGQGALNRLYDAADRMAADEGWDARTYDAVTAVFEDSMAGMVDLWSGMQSGDVQAAAARDEALAMRDDAQARLLEVLGQDGVDRLKGYMRKRGPPPVP